MKASRAEAMACGDRYYFTGKPCVRGHTLKRSVASGRCIECDRLASAMRKAENPEKIREYVRKYESTTRKNKPKEYHERRKQQKRDYANRKRDYFRKLKREKYAKNRDQALAKMKEWRKENKDIIRALNADYRGRKRGAEGKITIAVVKSLELHQKMKCNHCLESIEDGYHIDHKTPLINGGSNLKGNLQLLCPNCNLRKGALSQEEFENRELSNA